METTEQKIVRIKKFGMNNQDRVYLGGTDHVTSTLMLLAHVEHIEAKNAKMVEGLEAIASGLTTAGEASEIAEVTLMMTTLRNWRKNGQNRS